MANLSAPLINLFAALLLLIAFAMLSQRRILSLINLFALQGLSAASTAVVAYSSHQHLYYSAALTLVLKVIILPSILHRLIRKLNVGHRDAVQHSNVLVGIVLVVFAFNTAGPISVSTDQGTLGSRWRACCWHS